MTVYVIQEWSIKENCWLDTTIEFEFYSLALLQLMKLQNHRKCVQIAVKSKKVSVA